MAPGGAAHDGLLRPELHRTQLVHVADELVELVQDRRELLGALGVDGAQHEAQGLGAHPRARAGRRTIARREPVGTAKSVRATARRVGTRHQMRHGVQVLGDLLTRRVAGDVAHHGHGVPA